MNVYLSLCCILTFAIIQSCAPKHKASTFWVNSFKTECSAGAGKKLCLQINENGSPDSGSWEYFYSEIEGFEFKTGVLQKIKVKITPRESVPADASSLKYELIEVLEKKDDPKIALNDIWVAQSIDGHPVEDPAGRPRLEINLSKMQVFGFDGCNNYSGPIGNLTSNEITLGNLASTKKMCNDQMETAENFQKALTQSTHYKREGLSLALADSKGNTTIVFKKAD